MISISRILAPVDFSERCLAMMPLVRVVALKYSAELTLLHVVNPFYAVPPTAISGPIILPVGESAILAHQKRLDDFAVRDLEGVTVKRYVYEGDPARQIMEFARAHHIQLIVMPTHGYGPLRRFLIGSDTAKVLHDSPCPVLTGAHLEEHPTGKKAGISNILCAVDLKPRSSETLAWAFHLATVFQARLSLLHTLAPIQPMALSALPPDFAEQREKQAREEIEKLLKAAGAEAAAVYVEEGETPEMAGEFAKAAGADLLVIGRGTQDDSGGGLSSEAYAIIRQSPCPVLSV